MCYLNKSDCHIPKKLATEFYQKDPDAHVLLWMAKSTRQKKRNSKRVYTFLSSFLWHYRFYHHLPSPTDLSQFYHVPFSLPVTFPSIPFCHLYVRFFFFASFYYCEFAHFYPTRNNNINDDTHSRHKKKKNEISFKKVSYFIYAQVNMLSYKQFHWYSASISIFEHIYRYKVSRKKICRDNDRSSFVVNTIIKLIPIII